LSLEERKQFENVERTYNEAYRHFDDLIWRTPVWATGIFTVAVLGLDSTKQEFVAKLTGISANNLAATFLGILFLVLTALAHALGRFRVHQMRARPPYNKSPKNWRSAASIFNFLVSLEASALFCLMMLFLGVPIAASLAISGLVLITVSVVREYKVRREALQR
jgi:hypothetical protein